ncbi:hypothetical protein R9C00_21185 [Flammeovirgaceae bacterium SG7u.111]|nr:hypothetical protein [Flammeovirgaceae bacterium SG7u.132]WPO34217.1 hypothetical protein R9C00_21185 [Flammeovirgaceae bacterium SG7u.111]
MNLKTIRALIVSVVILMITILVASLAEFLELRKEDAIFFAFAMIISTGANVAGLVFSFAEMKKNKKWAITGLISNLSLIILFFITAFYAQFTR